MPFAEVSAAVLSDRAWFAHHPHARVRFRPERPGEFFPLEAAGHSVPAFTPHQHAPEIPLSWVAVLELSRLLGIEDQADLSSCRVRLRTIPIRSKAMQHRLAPVYEEAVLKDFLLHYSTDHSTTAA